MVSSKPGCEILKFLQTTKVYIIYCPNSQAFKKLQTSRAVFPSFFHNAHMDEKNFISTYMHHVLILDVFVCSTSSNAGCKLSSSVVESLNHTTSSPDATQSRIQICRHVLHHILHLLKVQRESISWLIDKASGQRALYYFLLGYISLSSPLLICILTTFIQEEWQWKKLNENWIHYHYRWCKDKLYISS